jgi:S1-C subfamily serine protease
LEELDDAGRQERALAPDRLALRVKNLGQFNKHGTAKKMGFLKDDVIVAFAGRTTRTTEGELIGEILTHHPIGETVEVGVLRGSERLTLKLPMQ